MKTIFRSLTIGLILGTIVALGAVAGFAQDLCTDADGQTKMQDEFDKLYAVKNDTDVRLQAINSGKIFLEKFGACESTKERSDWLKLNIPKMEIKRAADLELKAKNALTGRFNTALNAKNWNEVYASGKDILAKYPEEFRAAELVLGSIGLDETLKTPRVTTWNEDTLRYARMSITDLESGKVFKTFGVGGFTYKNKDDALGWMNYTIGYITAYGKGNKKEGISYLYKATQLASDTKTNPIVFESIGAYYYDDVKRLAGEVDALAKTQLDTDTPDIAKQKIDAIKAKVAMVNGTAEAAIDAYARANSLAKADPKKWPKAYADGLYKKVQELYDVRFGKPEGVDAFAATSIAKPFRDPSLPVTPVSDPEPVKPVATATTPATTPGTGPVKPGTTTVKPPMTTPAKPPVTAPTKTPAKPKAVVRKPVTKKKSV